MIRVCEWASANGIKLNVGVTKTTAILFATAPSDYVPPPIDVGDGAPIPFTTEYKFLGHRLTNTLDRDGEREDVLNKTKAAFGSFMGDEALRSCSIRFQSSMYSSAVMGAASHLISLVEPSRAFTNALDKLNTTAAAYVFRTSASQRGIAQMGAVDFGVISGLAILTREYNRFFFSMRRSGRVARTAAAVFRIVHDADGGISARRGHSMEQLSPATHRSWWVGWYYLGERNGANRAVNVLAAPDVGPLWAVSSMASSAGRRAGHAQWRTAQLAYLRGTGGVDVRDATSAVTSAKPLRHLFERYRHLPDQLPELGKGIVRLSAFGAGGASVLGASSAPIDLAIAVQRARLGRAGLFVPPVWRAPRGAPALRPDAFRAVYGTTTCNLCGGSRGDAVHFATLCTHPTVAARREALLGGGGLAAAVGALADALADAVDGGVPSRAFVDALAALAPDSAEGIFIVGSWLTAVTWPRASVPEEWTVAERLGRYFDRDVPAAAVASACTVWIQGAGRVLRVLCRDWPFLLRPGALARLHGAGFRLPPPPHVGRLDRNARLGRARV